MTSTARGFATADAAPRPAHAEVLPNPAPALQRRFEHILHTQLNGVPLLNPALRVQAVGFRPWSAHWLGVLVTPWFMNLMLLPRERAQWPEVGARESRHYVFPAGVFEFIGGRDAVLGSYQACSLFSPMFEFADPAAAHDTAVAALAALFDAAQRPRSDAPPAEATTTISATTATAAAAPGGMPPSHGGAAGLSGAQGAGPAAAGLGALSKRDFLLGGATRGPREP